MVHTLDGIGTVTFLPGMYSLEDGEGVRVAYISYDVREDGTWDLAHTVTDPEHRGKGYAGKLAAVAIADAIDSTDDVVVSCTYLVAKFPDLAE